MPIRINFEIYLDVSEDHLGRSELGKTPPWSGTNGQMSNGGTWRQRIGASEGEIEIDMKGMEGRLIAIKSDKELTVRKNNDSDVWTVKPLGVGAEDGILVMTTDGVESLYVENTDSGSLDADVTFSVAGIDDLG